MSNLQQMQEALKRAIKLTRDDRFTELHSKDEQKVYHDLIRELNEDISAEYEALEYIRRRDKGFDEAV